MSRSLGRTFWKTIFALDQRKFPFLYHAEHLSCVDVIIQRYNLINYCQIFVHSVNSADEKQRNLLRMLYDIELVVGSTQQKLESSERRMRLMQGVGKFDLRDRYEFYWLWPPEFIKETNPANMREGFWRAECTVFKVPPIK